MLEEPRQARKLNLTTTPALATCPAGPITRRYVTWLQIPGWLTRALLQLTHLYWIYSAPNHSWDTRKEMFRPSETLQSNRKKINTHERQSLTSSKMQTSGKNCASFLRWAYSIPILTSNLALAYLIVSSLLKLPSLWDKYISSRYS